MKKFWLTPAQKRVEEMEAELRDAPLQAVDTRSTLEKLGETVATTSSRLVARRDRLAVEISERQEELRMTNIGIEAMRAASGVIENG